MYEYVITNFWFLNLEILNIRYEIQSPKSLRRGLMLATYRLRRKLQVSASLYVRDSHMRGRDPNGVACQFLEVRSRVLDPGVASDVEESCMKNSHSNITCSARSRQNCTIVMTFKFVISEGSREFSQVRVWGRRTNAPSTPVLLESRREQSGSTEKFHAVWIFVLTLYCRMHAHNSHVHILKNSMQSCDL